jgi:hypothetical protein
MDEKKYRYYVEKPFAPESAEWFTVCECDDYRGATAVIMALLASHDNTVSVYRVRIQERY